MAQAITAVICSFAGSFIGYPALGYALGAKIDAALGWGNVENYVGTPTAAGKPAERAPRYQSNCPQCGGPHEAHSSVCLYCLTPRADAGPVEMIEVTTLEDAEPRYLPRYAVEPFAPPRK